MLGTDIHKVFSSDCNVTALKRDELDIADAGAVFRTVAEESPDIVVNCAAYTKVDECETETDTAYSVNGYGAGNIAAACAEAGSRLVHISTDYVFDGYKKEPYIEDDLTNPSSVYGRSKLLGEDCVRRFCGRHYIVRTQWLFGENGGNFVKTMLRLALVGGAIRVVNDQFGSPTYTHDLAGAIHELVQRPAYGTYHLTNAGVCSWFDLAREIFRLSGIDRDVTPCTTEEFPRPAKRPPYSALDNLHHRLAGGSPLRCYGEALSDYLKAIRS